jgi:hypothetical protein
MTKSLKFLFPALLLFCLVPAAAIGAPASDKPITTDIQLVQQAASVVPRDRVVATLRVPACA